MPRAPRCSYYINDKRCARNGKGNPPMCDRCRDVAAGKPNAQAGGGISDLAASILNGERISKDSVKRAMDEVLGAFRGQSVRVAPGAPSPRFAPGRYDPPPPAPPPREDPQVVMRTKVVAAMKTLGIPPSTKLTAEMLNLKRRELAKRFHPDKPGGSVAKMQQVNAAVDFLLALVEN